MSSLYKLHDDPRKFGPGMWLSIHILAYNAKNKDEQVIYCGLIRTLCSNITCHTCREHAVEFIKSNPPERVINENNTKTMFEWSCKLHNNANKITGASILNWELIYKEYEKNAPDSKNLKTDYIIKDKTPTQMVYQNMYDRIINNMNKK